MLLRQIKILITLIAIFWSHLLLGQQDAQFSQYMFINPYINPGATGINNNTDLALLYRYQWLGYKTSNGDAGGAPISQIFTGSTKIRYLNSGIGGYIINDEMGPVRNLNLKLNYAYNLKLGEGNLGFGIGVGIFNQGLNTAAYRPVVDPDPTIERLRAIGGNTTTLDINAGLFYQRENYYFGISANHINNPSYLGKSLDYNNSYVSRSYYITAGYNILLNDLFTLTPSFLLKNAPKIDKFSLVTTTADLSALVRYNKDQFWGGLSYRTGDAMVGMLGIGFLKNNSIKIGYAFDITVISSASKSGSSHEIMLTYSKPVADLLPKPIIRTPRYRF